MAYTPFETSDLRTPKWRTLLSTTWLLLGMSGVGGCSSSTPKSASQVCVPGDQVECSCGQRPAGVQRCDDDGSHFGACDCESGTSGNGAGGSAGSTQGAAGSSNPSGVGGSAGAVNPVGQCTGSPLLTSPRLFDFEDGKAETAQGVVGMFSDAATFEPQFATPEDGVLNGGANQTSKAFRFHGSGAPAGSYANGIVVSFIGCANAQNYSGLRFFVKSTQPVWFSVHTSNNTPTEFKGDCVGTFATCFNPMVDVQASSEWQEVTVVWADLVGGKPNPVEPAQIIGLAWNLTPPAGTEAWDFDISIDEVEWM